MHDADGLRRSKTAGGVTTPFTWNRSGDLPTLLGDGAASYVYGQGDTPMEAIIGSTVTYFHEDQLGSIRALTDQAGTVTAAHTYNSYGVRVSSTATPAFPFLFAGEYTDAESGFVYLRARYYDPGAATFISRDPLEPITGTPYAYVGNNPLNGVDPSGLYWGEGFVEEVVDVAQEIIRAPGAAFSDGAKGAANFGVGFTNAALGTDFAGFSGTGQSWSRNIGSATFLVEMGLSGCAPGGAESGIGRTTAHGAQRVAGGAATRGGVLGPGQIGLVRQGGQVLTQADGATVRILRNSAGRFDVVVDGERGLITTFSNLSQKSLDRLAGNYGWGP